MKRATFSKLFIDCISKIYLLGVLIFAVCLNANATTYTTISSGSYYDCSIWSSGCAPTTISANDTVIINHAVSATSTFDIDGVLIINATGSYTNNNDIDISVDGFLENFGSINVPAELHLDGTVYNSGIFIFKVVHNDGYICNSGSIETTESFWIHGGKVDCGGTIMTCDLQMDDNNSSIQVTGNVYAELIDQNICCSNGGGVIPVLDLNGSYEIDSLTVSICYDILKPNAGDDASSDICNSAGSIIDLNNLLSTDANLGGIFEEISSSGSFDAATGVFNTEGLTAGTYDFIYIANGYNATSDTASLMMTVKPTSAVIVDMLVCGSEIPLSWNGLSISTSGSHSVTFTNSAGCDSLITLHLTIEELEVPVVSSNSPVGCQGDLLSFSVDEIAGAQYEWFGPMGYSSQNTFNELEFYQDMSGSYGVYYTLNSCVSDITYIDLAVETVFEITDFDFPNVITANDDQINDYIDIEKYVGKCENFTLTVRDRWGVVVYNQERGDMAFSGKALTGDKLPEGVYFYTFSYGKEVVKNFLHIIH